MKTTLEVKYLAGETVDIPLTLQLQTHLSLIIMHFK